MNKVYWVLFLFILPLTINAQTASYQIDGKADAKYNGSLVTLFTFTGEYIRSVDSAYVANGHFSFEGPEYLYEKSLLTIGSYPDTVLVAELLLERGPIEVEMKAKSEVRSPTQREYQQFRDSSAILGKRVDALNGTEAYEEAFRQYDLYRFQFKKKHIHNGLGRSLFLDETGISDADLSDQLYELLSHKDKQRCDVRSDFEKRKKRDRKKHLLNQPYLDFTLINANGEERKIADYAGKSKLLFLDFWASWCGPCIAQKPQIKELYKKYKGDGFEVLSISLDENVDSWLAALKKNSNVFAELSAGSKEQVKALRELYCITGIPDGVLIDQDGRIVDPNCNHWLRLKSILEAYYKK